MIYSILESIIFLTIITYLQVIGTPIFGQGVGFYAKTAGDTLM